MSAATTCERCQAEILFVRTDNGKKMPIDAKPSPDGNIAVSRNVVGTHVGHALRAGESPIPGERRHLAHFASCGKQVDPPEEVQ
jgi:hypothetical protein